MSDDLVAFPRQHGRRDFLSIGAAAAAVVAGIGAAQSAPTEMAADPLPALVKRRMEIVEWINTIRV